jgi:hypothetical protein
MVKRIFLDTLIMAQLVRNSPELWRRRNTTYTWEPLVGRQELPNKDRIDAVALRSATRCWLVVYQC